MMPFICKLVLVLGKCDDDSKVYCNYQLRLKYICEVNLWNNPDQELQHFNVDYNMHQGF
jgi:hypothetical protein